MTKSQFKTAQSMFGTSYAAKSAMLNGVCLANVECWIRG